MEKNIEIAGVEITGPLIKGSFIERPNRFITIVKVGNKSVKSHLPDPGRLSEILTPGRELYLRKAIASEHRVTDYSTILAKYNGELVSLVSALPNKFVKECIDCIVDIYEDIETHLEKKKYVEEEIDELEFTDKQCFEYLGLERELPFFFFIVISK